MSAEKIFRLTDIHSSPRHSRPIKAIRVFFSPKALKVNHAHYLIRCSGIVGHIFTGIHPHFMQKLFV
ncbi:hypothetical protein JN06_01550 [Bacteroides zoogleoformans]|nr:hypothetical protein JN06_01550 [Bacteroides zoogleoformans]